MKILISTDIEGIAGVFHSEQARPGNVEYERARAWMTGEANAAVVGAYAAGAQSVLVNDSHGGFRNLLPDALDPRAQIVLGKPRYLGMMGGLDTDCDGVFMVGYHSRAQSRGILAHTMNGAAFAKVIVNGMELGEAGLYGALAGEYGVPVALASGDDVFIEETRALFPGAQWVQTKVAHGQGTGVTLSPAAARERIGSAAREAMASLGRLAPFVIAAPITCLLQTQTSALADLFCQWPSLERIDGVRLQFNAPSIEASIRILNCLSAMSFMLR
jgi:D-amino peptidase